MNRWTLIALTSVGVVGVSVGCTSSPVVAGRDTTDPSPSGSGTGSGSGRGSDAAAEASSEGGNGGGETCVAIPLSTVDTSCETSSDCVIVPNGTCCDDTCYCNTSAVNSSASSQFAGAAHNECSGVMGGACSCPVSPAAECVAGSCVAKSGTVGEPDASTQAEAGNVGSDAGTCVAVSLSTVDTSCTTASDCVVVPNGTCCDDTCYCNTSAVNSSAASQFAGAAHNECSGVMGGGCSCPTEPKAACTAGTCTLSP